jgi:hypothetical protein
MKSCRAQKIEKKKGIGRYHHMKGDHCKCEHRGIARTSTKWAGDEDRDGSKRKRKRI